jgi:hypothetical protein
LSPEALNRNLVHAGLFLVAFELVKNLVVKPVKFFYQDTTFGAGMPFTTYEQDVLSRHKNVFEASLLYLRDHFQTIRSEDLDAIQALREQRNRIAHDLTQLLPGMSALENYALLSKAREALFRLSNFWVYIEVGSDPEFTSRNIDWDAAYGEDLLLLDQIIEGCRSYGDRDLPVFQPKENASE